MISCLHSLHENRQIELESLLVTLDEDRQSNDYICRIAVFFVHLDLMHLVEAIVEHFNTTFQRVRVDFLVPDKDLHLGVHFIDHAKDVGLKDLLH